MIHALIQPCTSQHWSPPHCHAVSLVTPFCSLIYDAPFSRRVQSYFTHSSLCLVFYMPFLWQKKYFVSIPKTVKVVKNFFYEFYRKRRGSLCAGERFLLTWKESFPILRKHLQRSSWRIGYQFHSVQLNQTRGDKP